MHPGFKGPAAFIRGQDRLHRQGQVGGGDQKIPRGFALMRAGPHHDQVHRDGTDLRANDLMRYRDRLAQGRHVQTGILPVLNVDPFPIDLRFTALRDLRGRRRRIEGGILPCSTHQLMPLGQERGEILSVVEAPVEHDQTGRQHRHKGLKGGQGRAGHGLRR